MRRLDRQHWYKQSETNSSLLANTVMFNIRPEAKGGS
jgi:hypothetical protein